MSIEFTVVGVDQNIQSTDLRHETEVVLRELLNLGFTPTLTTEWIGDFEVTAGQAQITTFELPDQGQATLTYLDLPHEDLSVAGTERTAMINGSGWRTDASVALALALGIALARRLGKPLNDDALLFSAELCVAPDILLAEVRLKSRHSDLKTAARELLSSKGLRFGSASAS